MCIAVTPSAFAVTSPLTLSLVIALRRAVVRTRDWTSRTGRNHDRLVFLHLFLCHTHGDITSGAVKKWVPSKNRRGRPWQVAQLPSHRLPMTLPVCFRWILGRLLSAWDRTEQLF